MGRVVDCCVRPAVAGGVALESVAAEPEVNSGCFRGYSIDNGQSPLRLRGGAGDELPQLSIEARRAEIPNVENPADISPLVADGGELWNNVDESVEKALRERDFVFTSYQGGAADGEDIGFRFFRKRLTLSEAKNMALFAILTMFQKHSELFSNQNRLLKLINAFGEEKIYAEELMPLMQVVTEGNFDGILKFLNCGVTPSMDAPHSTFENFQKFIVDEFDDATQAESNENIRCFLETFCCYSTDKICSERSEDGDILSIESGLGIIDCHANFSDNKPVAEAFERVFSALGNVSLSSSLSSQPQLQLYPRHIIASKQRFADVFAIVPGIRIPFFFRDGETREKYAKCMPIVFNVDVAFQSERHAIGCAMCALGFFYYFQSPPGKDALDAFKEYTKRDNPMHEKIKNQVSLFAATDEYGADFVSTVFAGLAVGKKYDADILDIYAALGGPTFDFEKLERLLLDTEQVADDEEFDPAYTPPNGEEPGSADAPLSA